MYAAAAAAAAADGRIHALIDDNWLILSIAVLTFVGFHRDHSQYNCVVTSHECNLFWVSFLVRTTSEIIALYTEY